MARYYLRRLDPDAPPRQIWAEDAPTYIMVSRNRTRLYNAAYHIHALPIGVAYLPERPGTVIERISSREYRQAVGPARYWRQVVEDLIPSLRIKIPFWRYFRLSFRFPSLRREETEDTIQRHIFAAHSQPPEVSLG